jgi:TatD DNase family protein
LRVLREDWDPALGGVFHCFAGDAPTALAAVGLNFDIAVGGVLTFKSARALREVIAQVPLERLVLETDGPWLAPQAWRGQRNEPARIPAIAAQVAELKGVDVDRVAQATTANARRLFRLPAE